MTTIELNGVTLTLTEKTLKALKAEQEEDRREAERKQKREREERRFQWYMWHWYGRRWAMYGDAEDGGIFSDMCKEECGFRPRMTPEEVMWILYRRECWIEHGLH